MASEIRNSSPVDLVKAFLACTKTKDAEAMRRMIHPSATACLIREGEPRFRTLTDTITTLEKAEQEVAEATWDEVEHVDGDYATVWTNFSIHMDGKVDTTLVDPQELLSIPTDDVAVASAGLEFIFVLEKPYFGLDNSDYDGHC